MGRLLDFKKCLMQKDMNTLYGLLHCLHHLHEALVDDAQRLADHLDATEQALLRRCDLCGENMSRHMVMELLTMTEHAITEREDAHKFERND